MQSNPQVPWTEEQWMRVNLAIQEEAQRARVAAKFLPLYGPLSPDTDFVRWGDIPYTAPLTIYDRNVLQLATLQIRVELRGAQLADPEMSSALSLFRRAANVITRLEDALIFNGRHTPPPPALPPLPPLPLPVGSPGVGEEYLGVDATGLYDRARYFGPPVIDGVTLVEAIAAAIGGLELDGHFGPFAVALGHNLFLFAQTPAAPLTNVIPQDRIIPFLRGGPLVRSSVLHPDTGVVVALGGEPVQFVVATDITLQFLQVTEDPIFVFRVYEKVALRIKEDRAIALLARTSQPPPPPPGPPPQWPVGGGGPPPGGAGGPPPQTQAGGRRAAPTSATAEAGKIHKRESR
jgi:uncharacterized linocin/CFP29 family protein